MDRRTFLAMTAGVAMAPLLGRASGDGATFASDGMAALLARLPQDIRGVLDADEHRVEVLFVRQDGRGRWQTARHGERWARTWSPAASVAKLPLALLVAERLHALGLDADAVLRLFAAPATGEWGDEPLEAPFRRDLARTFAISENVPFNRWYDLLGADALHVRLREMGYPHVRLISRLGSSNPSANRRTGGGEIVAPGGAVAATFPARDALLRQSDLQPALLGPAWQYDDGHIEHTPRDMRYANVLPLADSLRMLQAFVSPASVPPRQRWRIGGVLRRQLLAALAMSPADSTDPVYDPVQFPPGYARFFFHGPDGRSPLPADLRVYGKSGEAYGFMSEVAHVVDAASGAQFLLAARVRANADGVVNDDRYEYEELARPVMAALADAALAVVREAAGRSSRSHAVAPATRPDLV